jgi:hypothetical protein
VVIEAATGPVRGKLTKPIHVSTNDRANPDVRLDCEAEILSALKCDPNILNFGLVKRGDGQIEKTVKITRGSGGPLKPRVLSTTNPLVTADMREVEPGESYELSVVARPPWPNGPLRANVQIETGVEQVPIEIVMVSANIMPRVQIVPPRFVIRPDLQSGGRLVARVKWDNDKPGTVTEALVNDPSLTVRVEEQKNQQVIALLVPSDYSVPPNRTVQVTVKTDDPVAPVLQMPVNVMTAPHAGQTVAPAARPAPPKAAPGGPAARATPTPRPTPQPATAPAGGAGPK